MDPLDGGTSLGQSAGTSATANKEDVARQTSAKSAKESQSIQETLQTFTDRALDFLSTASNETIGACLVGLGASTYLVLGRVGLVLIGVAGGVVLHATWEGTRGAPDARQGAVDERRRKEVGLDVIQRVLNWRTKTQADEANDHGEVRVDTFGLTERDLDFSDFRPETADALRAIADAVIRDYVKWWYSPIIPGEETFPDASRITLTSFILGISNNLARKRPADAFVNFVTHTSSTVVVFLNELASALNASPTATVVDAVRVYIEMKPNSSLANVLDTRQQKKKLALVAEDILQTYLDPKTLKCQPAHVFLRQILSNTIIDNTIDRCSEAWWINDWIVYLLEEPKAELAKSVGEGLEMATEQAAVSVAENAAATRSNDPARRSSDAELNRDRVVSRGQEAFDDAMKEAARLTKLMQEEDERAAQEQASHGRPIEQEELQTPVQHESFVAAASAVAGIGTGSLDGPSTTSIDEHSESTTQGIDTPTSSQSEKNTGIDADPEERVLSMGSQRSEQELAASAGSEANAAPFLSFDQLAPSMTGSSPDDADGAPREREPLTLYNASMTIFDDSVPGDKSAVKTKPIVEYLIQIEPASSAHSGWMVAKKYSDVETLHESLRRISVVTGAKFHETHPTVPQWKGRTKSQLREALERYLNDACRAKTLAESEAMRRFLEKEQGLMKSPGNKGGLNAAFGAVGKGITGVGKGIEGGGKAFVGGVTGVFGGLGPKKAPGSSKDLSRTSVDLGRNRSESVLSVNKARQSTDSLRKTVTQAQAEGTSTPSLDSERRSSILGSPEGAAKLRPDSPAPDSISGEHADQPNGAAPEQHAKENGYAALSSEEMMQLPPPPSEVTDDYDGHAISSPTSPVRRSKTESIFSTATTLAEPADTDQGGYTALPSDPDTVLPQRKVKPARQYPPLNDEETTIVVELLFATITELYTLSSAWSLRRTLLNAAKTYLLRPGNPQLLSIRDLLNTTVLEANTSDAGIAAQLRKLRENSLPTEEEFAAWPKELDDKQKEELKKKARKLLVQKGMPVALTSVMGQAASGEAMGRVFDALQVKEIARGLMFGLMLQGIRTIVQ